MKKIGGNWDDWKLVPGFAPLRILTISEAERRVISAMEKAGAGRWRRLGGLAGR
jgi:hypothetical protein